MDMRILLVNPPQIIPRNWNEMVVYQPLGLAYIAATLEQAGYDVRILDTLALGWRKIKSLDWNKRTNNLYLGLEMEDVKRYIKYYSPDIVGVGIPFSSQSWGAFQVAKACKKVDPKIVTIAGGAHPSVRPIDTVKDQLIDIVVIGEGECTTLELVQTLETRGNSPAILRKIKGIAFMDGTTPVVTPNRPFINDLDSIPFH